tara:strand:+ start:70 stop:174 length:105 start_codon:yes stop_codon:yes gene_type:complete
VQKEDTETLARVGKLVLIGVGIMLLLIAAASMIG